LNINNSEKEKEEEAEKCQIRSETRRAEFPPFRRILMHVSMSLGWLARYR